MTYNMSGNGTDNRRGSSLFPTSCGYDVSGPYGRPAYLHGKHDDDLVMKPNHNNYQDYSRPEGNSSNMEYSTGQQSISGGSDVTSSSNNGAPSGSSTNQKPRRGEAARMEELANSQSLPGGLYHRPLVGGFAAAAYEAAKAHHYSMKSNPDYDEDKFPIDRSLPPSI
mmetsp:Transcript_313/g.521  ORF Transcript_313/g.521 Transcript_313/m.521 type:complete len:167 (-) Transcript_313:135-635(-)